MRYKLFLFSLLTLAMSVVSIVVSNEETSVDVKFEILTGLGIQDYYSGDHFWYNITLTNSGTTTINATFTVTIRNSTGGVFGEVVSYKRYLELNDTTILFPNYTRLGKEEVYVYFMDTAGTYSIQLTSDIPVSFYRCYETGRYTVEHNKCHMNIDVMPSYQRQQNERWNQFLQENENYMNIVQAYIEQSRRETQKTQILAFASAMIAVLFFQFEFVTLSKTKRKQHRKFYIFLGVMILVILLFIFAFYILL